MSPAQQHPAPDPVNALLSLGYVMITNELAGLLDAMSFDPYFGFLHGIRYGRLSLALDLVEQFRQPLGDRFTLHLVNHRVFQPEDFEPQPDGATYLKEEARKRYFAQFAERMLSRGGGQPARSWREWLRVQVEALRKCLMEGTDYPVYTIVD